MRTISPPSMITPPAAEPRTMSRKEGKRFFTKKNTMSYFLKTKNISKAGFNPIQHDKEN